MAYPRKTNHVYKRPDVAKKYLDFGSIAVYPGTMEESVVLPALAKLRPMAFNWFQEATDVPEGEASVICSGAVVLNAARNRVGILKLDTKPGDEANIVINGTYWLPIDYLGDSGSPSRTACSLTGLNGKKAYLLVDQGLVTDQDPGADWPHLEIGWFQSQVGLDPVVNGRGFWKAQVRLDPNVTNAAVSLPADAATTFSNVIFSQATISNFVGLDQTLYAEAAVADPNYELREQDFTWLLEGGTTYTGRKIGHTFSAGSGRTVRLTVARGGVTEVKNYTVTIATDAAPASFVQV